MYPHSNCANKVALINRVSLKYMHSFISCFTASKKKINYFLLFLEIPLCLMFFIISRDSFKGAKEAEKDTEFVSYEVSDEGKIVALQNKKDLPLKRQRKPKIFDNFDDKD